MDMEYDLVECLCVVLKSDDFSDVEFFIWNNCQPIKRKKEGEEKRMCQEDMLLEAAQTGFNVIFFFVEWGIVGRFNYSKEAWGFDTFLLEFL